MSTDNSWQHLTFAQWVVNIAANGASESDALWAIRKREFFDAIETSMDQTRAHIRSSVLDSMLRTDEEEH